MTFVAQPFERFSDDLVSALTGAVVREEHQFVGVQESYTLASPGVIEASVKVFGQHKEAFFLFEGGIDYDFDSVQEAVNWRENGKHPDDRSFFYINYYPREAQRRLTDRNPGSVTWTLASSFAREFAVLSKQMELIYESAFVELATGRSLEHIAALLNITRKDAKFARGEVLFKRTTPAPGDIAIPVGTVVSTATGVNFETAVRRVLRRGQLSVPVTVRAQLEGPSGQVEPGTITNVNRPIFGIESVLNDAATFFATDKETDVELRQRITGTLQRAGRSTLESIKLSLVEDIPQVNEGNVKLTETNEPGMVEAKFGLGGKVDQETVQQIERTIFNTRAAGIRVSHNLPKLGSADGAAASAMAREEVIRHFSERGIPHPAVHVPETIAKRMPEGTLDLQIEVLLRLTDASVSTAKKEEIEDGVRQRVMQFIDDLPMGSELVYSKLLGKIVDSEEINDAELLIRVAPLGGGLATEAYKSNLATDGRKVRTDSRHVFVGLAGEAVRLDLLVRLEPIPGAEESASPSAQVESVIDAAVRQAIQDVEGTLSRSSLRTAIADAIADHGLQLIADNPLAMNVEFEATGRLLNNTEEVPVASHQVIEPRDLNVELKDELDA